MEYSCSLQHGDADSGLPPDDTHSLDKPSGKDLDSIKNVTANLWRGASDVDTNEKSLERDAALPAEVHLPKKTYGQISPPGSVMGDSIEGGLEEAEERASENHGDGGPSPRSQPKPDPDYPPPSDDDDMVSAPDLEGPPSDDDDITSNYDPNKHSEPDEPSEQEEEEEEEEEEKEEEGRVAAERASKRLLQRARRDRWSALLSRRPQKKEQEDLVALYEKYRGNMNQVYLNNPLFRCKTSAVPSHLKWRCMVILARAHNKWRIELLKKPKTFIRMAQERMEMMEPPYKGRWSQDLSRTEHAPALGD
ncbi:hypothetical protein QBC34DRAFT_428259 [Podospora aff. communis PSN243]|uniref:Uncharacterized protein n=1 Tax=Podospora aff. communis PSN243 TaxID=3040156 RepID=A0AAV9GFL2_9PEZI|nr:hypothetical protein QBC34DRAFT_428259 [Podospora aff. communis PSN243]